jgi:adenine-specific DNA-methyltransferase
MKRLTPDSPELKSADLVAENIDRLRALFPEAFANEGKIDFDVLRQLLGDRVDDGEERYGLNWHGKRAARQLALTPSTGTLRPCPEESIDWDTTQNIFIEGDNLEVLKLLQKSYAGKVKLIYIDPPYNTGKDFVYPDDFTDNMRNYLELTGQSQGGVRVTSNPEAGGRFHTQWLSMMLPRLRLARTLLRNDGVIAVSIDDNEEPSLRKIMDEVFGEENHVATVVWQKRYVSNVTAKWLSDMHDYVVIYAHTKDAVAVSSWNRTEEQLAAYKNPDNDPRGPWRAQDLSASKPYSAGMFTITGPKGGEFDPPPNRYWRCNREQFNEWCKDNRIWWGVNQDARPMLKSFLSESERGITPHTWWDYDFAGHNKEATLELKDLFGGDAPFDTPKPVRLIHKIIELFCSPDQLVMDFFCGSGTTGHAVMQAAASSTHERLRYILVQLPEATSREGYSSLAAIATQRLRLTGDRIRATTPTSFADVGFRVFKLDSGNVRPWDANRDTVAEALAAAVDHVKPDRTESDLLYEVILKHGLGLCDPIEEKRIAGHKVCSVGAGAVFACFGSRITSGDIDQLADGIAKWRDDLGPAKPAASRVVFRDSAFETDVAKTNLALILKERGFDEKLVVSL